MTTYGAEAGRGARPPTAAEVAARIGAVATRDGGMAARIGAVAARIGAVATRDGGIAARDGAVTAHAGAVTARAGAVTIRDGIAMGIADEYLVASIGPDRERAVLMAIDGTVLSTTVQESSASGSGIPGCGESHR